MARRHHDDPRPGRGFAIRLGDEMHYLTRAEMQALAPLAQLHHALGALPQEIAEILKAKLIELRSAKRFFREE